MNLQAKRAENEASVQNRDAARRVENEQAEVGGQTFRDVLLRKIVIFPQLPQRLNEQSNTLSAEEQTRVERTKRKEGNEKHQTHFQLLTPPFFKSQTSLTIR